MGFLDFIDTFFFVSLGITFVLISFLVYHFKDRLTIIETKTDTMFQIVNNIVQELKNIKTMVVFNQSPSMYVPKPNMEFHINENYIGNTGINDDVEYDSENENENNDEKHNVSLADADDDVHDDTDADEVDNEHDDTDDELQPDGKEYALYETNNTNVDREHLQSETEIYDNHSNKSVPYSKMSVNALRSIIVSRGINENPSKMKKNDLVALLEMADTK
jgi:hypothetical protein